MIRAFLAALLCCAALPVAAELEAGLRWLARAQYGNAYRELKEAAEEGDATAAVTLGWMLERGMEAGGKRLEARPEEAARWYQLAAGRGDRHAKNMMGVLSMAGHGVPRDIDKSLEWFAKVRDVEVMVSSLSKYPPEDRREIAAWIFAVPVVLQRELKYPRGASSRNAWGTVVLRFEAERNSVTVVRSDAISIITQAAEEMGRRAVQSAPPPPAAVRNNASQEIEINFSLKRE